MSELEERENVGRVQTCILTAGACQKVPAILSETRGVVSGADHR